MCYPLLVSHRKILDQRLAAPKKVYEPGRGPAQGNFKENRLLMMIFPFKKSEINDYFLEKH